MTSVLVKVTTISSSTSVPDTVMEFGAMVIQSVSGIVVVVDSGTVVVDSGTVVVDSGTVVVVVVVGVQL